jgi:homoserine kinase
VPDFADTPVHVRVPATSANLGPGFDSAGLALELVDDVVVEVTSGGLAVEVVGEGADDLPRDERHLVVRALRASFDRLGGQPPGLSLHCTNRIPHARGLGSSSAAIVAGVVAARALVVGGDDILDARGALDLANELEGHPDNVAACLLGGLTFAWTTPSGPRAVRVEPSDALAPVVLVPATTASTAHVRGLLPSSVPYADAVLNASRAALLPLAMTRDPALLLAATEDRLHQGYRAPSMPATAALVEQLRAAGVPAVVSGAGPSVLALTTREERSSVTAVDRPGWSVRPLEIALQGARVVVPAGDGNTPIG